MYYKDIKAGNDGRYDWQKGCQQVGYLWLVEAASYGCDFNHPRARKVAAQQKNTLGTDKCSRKYAVTSHNVAWAFTFQAPPRFGLVLVITKHASVGSDS